MVLETGVWVGGQAGGEGLEAQALETSEDGGRPPVPIPGHTGGSRGSRPHSAPAHICLPLPSCSFGGRAGW